ncbi:MAG: hypothetical protein IJ746_01615 [Ruminococcus sp.]|nr:hypothetical protein [Ruminococcus sp.]
MNKKTMLTVIIPAFAACAYLLGAILAKNKELKRLFSTLSGFMAGQIAVELIRYLRCDKETEEE